MLRQTLTEGASELYRPDGVMPEGGSRKASGVRKTVRETQEDHGYA
jgi:hypothetical protein